MFWDLAGSNSDKTVNFHQYSMKIHSRVRFVCTNMTLCVCSRKVQISVWLKHIQACGLFQHRLCEHEERLSSSDHLWENIWWRSHKVNIASTTDQFYSSDRNKALTAKATKSSNKSCSVRQAVHTRGRFSQEIEVCVISIQSLGGVLMLCDKLNGFKMWENLNNGLRYAELPVARFLVLFCARMPQCAQIVSQSAYYLDRRPK